MMTENETYTLLFEAGEGEGYWTIEENQDGLLVVTSNAETHRVIEPPSYHGWDADEFRAALRKDGMEDGLINRILEQAGL